MHLHETWFSLRKYWCFCSAGRQKAGESQIPCQNQEKVKSDIRVKVAEILLKAEFPTEQVDKLIPVIMRQTESNYGEMEFEI